MSRRRMMMQQLSQKLDLLDGYRIDNQSIYKVNIVWLDEHTIEFTHASKGFLGVNSAAANFIGATRGWAQGPDGALIKTPPMATLEVGKEYKLTLTVTEIVNNTATTENDGVMALYFGAGGGATADYFSAARINFSEIQVGQQIEVIKLYLSERLPITSAAIGVNNPDLIWNIKFNVKLEEV